MAAPNLVRMGTNLPVDEGLPEGFEGQVMRQPDDQNLPQVQA